MGIADYFRDLWSLIAAALSLDTNALTSLAALPNAGWLALGLVILAGVSRLLGDSVVLFINRVSPKRFILSLFGGGLLFAVELALWAVSIWFIVSILGTANSLSIFLFIVAVASAPWLFGVLVFAPYFGGLVRWVLRIWSWLIVFALLSITMHLSFAAAFLAATTGWLLLRVLAILFARRIRPLRDRLWTRLTGKPSELSFEAQAQMLSLRLRESLPGADTASK